MSYAIMTRLPYGEVILLLLHHLLLVRTKLTFCLREFNIYKFSPRQSAEYLRVATLTFTSVKIKTTSGFFVS